MSFVPDLATLIQFGVATVILAATPGPDMTLFVSRTLNQGRAARFASMFGALSGNHRGFHKADGSGYRLLADWLIRLDPLNPQTTARVAGAFGTWRMFDPARQAAMRGELERIAAVSGLSRDTAEIVGRLLREDG